MFTRLADLYKQKLRLKPQITPASLTSRSIAVQIIDFGCARLAEDCELIRDVCGRCVHLTLPHNLRIRLKRLSCAVVLLGFEGTFVSFS
jgi:hypothetical protein